MSKNNVKSLFDQQYGLSRWRESDAVLHRLRCTKQNAYTQLLPPVEEDEFYRDTPIFACKFALQQSNENFVALANEDGKLAVHDSDTGTRHGIHAHNNAVFDLAWMFDRMKIVTASGDHTSKLYDMGNGEIREEKVFCGHTRSVKTVSFRKDDTSVFASGGRDGNIILWDTRTDQNSFVGKADRTITNSHTCKVFTPSKSRRKYISPAQGVKSVTGLVFQDENTLISCGAGDGIIKMWDLRRNYITSRKEALPKSTIPYTGSTSKNGFSSLIIDREGIRLYANCLDNTIYCYNVSTCNNEPIMHYTGHQNSTFYIKSALCKDGNYLVSGSSDEHAYIWNVKQSRPLVKLTGHTAEVTCVAWCYKNTSLITCSDDMTHKIWTIGPEELSEDWDAIGGRAEVLPLEKNSQRPILKRLLNDIPEETPKKFVHQCLKCEMATVSKRFCEKCKITSSKRKAECELTNENKKVTADVASNERSFDDETGNENKRLSTELGPRRLFRNFYSLQQNEDRLAEPLTQKDHNVTSEHQDSIIQAKNVNSEHDTFSSPSTKAADIIASSPTINLPNYVIDGVAPHINFSPPKRKSQDWLTKMRIERNLRQEMIEKTMGPSSPKTSKIELTPKSKTSGTPRSPLLRFFKVTNSNNKCDGNACSSKAHNCNFLSSSQQLSQ